jgi:hypothetical protein
MERGILNSRDRNPANRNSRGVFQLACYAGACRSLLSYQRPYPSHQNCGHLAGEHTLNAPKLKPSKEGTGVVAGCNTLSTLE